MDRLELVIQFERYSSQPEGKYWLAVEGLVNGILVAKWEHLPIDLDALKASSVVEGDYYIWNCSCGHPACAGLQKPIVVVHGADTISWLGSNLPINQFPDLHFDREAYTTEVRRAMKRMKTEAYLHRGQGEAFEFALRGEEELFWRKEDRESNPSQPPKLIPKQKISKQRGR